MRNRIRADGAGESPEQPARRRALIAGVATLAGVAAATPGWARRLAQPAGGREIALLNLHTGERLRAEYWRNGRYVPDAMRAISVVLRDHCNNKIHPIEPRLLDVVHLLHGQLRSRTAFDVICGYRSPETNAMMHEASAGVAAHSLHMEGRAIDIRLPGVALGALKREAMRLALGGVGYYPSDDFVHIDSGDIRHWRG
jgi:uncharacterized protein YcbK (DUF882 family)